MKRRIYAVCRMAACLCALSLVSTGCLNREQYVPGEPESPDGAVPGDLPDIPVDILPWNGANASDGNADVAGTDPDIYHEATTFPLSVEVKFAGDAVEVSAGDAAVKVDSDRGHVVVDLSGVPSNAEIRVSGTTSDGSLKIYGKKPVKLVLDGVDITSGRGPAINCQANKKLYVEVADGKVNRLRDASVYSDDVVSKPTSDGTPEDRKGCLFSEADVIFSGGGILMVEGFCRDAIAVDGYMTVRPGSTIVVNNAAKHAINVKGDLALKRGITVMGGYIYAHTSGDAGKAMRSEQSIRIDGGELHLNTSGNAVYDMEKGDTSSGSCIKSEAGVTVNGGDITLHATGAGGKGINATGAIIMKGGEIVATTSGGRYVTGEYSSSPKGVKSGGRIVLSGGSMKIYVADPASEADGLESMYDTSVSGCDLYVYASGDAIKARGGFDILSGTVYSYSVLADGIDTNGSLIVGDAVVTAIGGAYPESGIDISGESFTVSSGAEIIAFGGEGCSLANAMLPESAQILDMTGMRKGFVSDEFPEGFSLPRSFGHDRPASVVIIR